MGEEEEAEDPSISPAQTVQIPLSILSTWASSHAEWPPHCITEVSMSHTLSRLASPIPNIAYFHHVCCMHLSLQMEEQLLRSVHENRSGPPYQ